MAFTLVIIIIFKRSNESNKYNSELFFGAVIKTLTVVIAINIVMVVSVCRTGNWGNTNLAVLYMAGKVTPLLSIGIQEG